MEVELTMPEKCICDECPRRFECFTQKKVFSEPDYQAMYEAYLAEGLEHLEAVQAVREHIERKRNDNDLDKFTKQKKYKDYTEWKEDWDIILKTQKSKNDGLKRNTIMNAKAEHAKCDECTLKNNKFVPTKVHSTNLVVLAEAPGLNETIEGEPLVGVAGKELNSIMKECGLNREDATYMNSVNCRPTAGEKNRTPTELEIECCHDRLIYELDQLNPNIIIVMGKTPYTALGGSMFVRMADVVGTELLYLGNRAIITYHPAAISHSGGANSERGKMIRDEIKKAFERAKAWL